VNSYSVGSAPEVANVWRLPAALHALRPEAAHLLERVNERARERVDPALLELVRLRTAHLIGNRAGTEARSAAGVPEDKIGDLAAYPTSPRFTAADREGLAFAEQFVFDVSGTTPESLEALAGIHGRDSLADVVTAVYIVEFTQRLQVMARLLLEPSRAPEGRQPDPDPYAEADGTLRSLLAAYQNAVVRGTSLDAVVTELVRLRCARTHQCRICSTLRLADARADGVDETMTAKIDFYEASDLPDRCKVALRITDAFIIRPDLLTEATIAEAHSIFDPEQLAELCLDITKWSTQKIHVALGTDGADNLPVNEAGTAFFGFDDSGRVAGFSAS
jgi:alkylhydroperoxidase family enzyme